MRSESRGLESGSANRRDDLKSSSEKSICGLWESENRPLARVF
jgi:hypothetical protein